MTKIGHWNYFLENRQLKIESFSYEIEIFCDMIQDPQTSDQIDAAEMVNRLRLE